MLGRARHANATPRSAAAKATPTMQRLWRQALWGSVAAAALLVAILSSRDDVAVQRAALVFSSLSLRANQAAPRAFDAESATRQVAEAVHGLTADRDRLMTRLAAVERDLDDMTGSIKQQIEAVKTASSQAVPPWPDDAPPVPLTPADIAAMVKPAEPPLADPSPASPPAYGADISSAASIKALNTHWVALRSAHPQLFEGLLPVVSLRKNSRTNRTELHLVVGPLPNAEAAAQLCGLLGTFRLSCQPTMFDGRHLALQ